MNKIIPKEGILLIKKHKQTAYKTDMAIVDDEQDRRLITGEVISGTSNFKKGSTVIFGKYALYQLTIRGVDYFLLDEQDVVGICDYREDV